MISTRSAPGSAERQAAGLGTTLADLKGITSANAMASALNARGHVASRGVRWSARTVLKVTARRG